MRNAPALLGVLVLLSSCSGAEQPGGGSSSDSAAPATIELRWRLEPASEEYVCRYYVVPDAGFDVARAVYDLGERSHHLLVWSTSLAPDAVDVDGAVIRHCDEDGPSHAAIDGLLLGAQPGTGSFSFPTGAALRLRPGQVLLIEHHAVNSGAVAAELRASILLYPAGAPIRAQVGLLHYYDWAIRILPDSTATARMRCVVPEEIQLLSVHGHMHARGVSFRAWTAQSGESAPFHVSYAWDAAPQALAPAVGLSAGDSIEFECAYDNPDARSVYQGLSAHDSEMCSLTAFYVASDSERLDPLAEVCGQAGSGIMGQGSVDCRGVETCLLSVFSSMADPTLQRIAAQDCWLEGCAEATLSFSDLVVCRATYCSEPCGVLSESGWLLASKANEAACISCLSLSCGASVEGCASSTCLASTP